MTHRHLKYSMPAYAITHVGFSGCMTFLHRFKLFECFVAIVTIMNGTA